MPIPQDTNFLTPSSFKVAFGRNEMKGLEFYLQSVELPTLAIGEATYRSPTQDVYVPGDTVIYDPFTINILCDEGMSNYAAVAAWMKSLVNGKYDKSLYSDVSLIVLNSSNNPTKTVVFHDAFPTTMSGTSFETSRTSIDYVSFNVTFRYSYFEIL